MYFPDAIINLIYYFLFGFFLVAALGELLYYLFLYGRVSYAKTVEKSGKEPISVIICARNEAANLRKNLEAILEQKHENFEVVVVNDCSSDDTDDVLGEYLKQYKHLRTTSITPDKKFTHGKKLALTVGIKAAKNECLVFTDADCFPVSDQWLNCIQENFSARTDIVIGYGGYESRKGFLNSYIRFDTLIIAMQYISFALAGMPYMGVGRNLAYRKSLFFKNKGFASHYGLLSGDDDLFVNETATKENVSLELRPESFTLSDPKRKWRDWFRQKRRHFTTSGHYKAKHIFYLGLEPLLRTLFYITFAYLLILKIYWIPVLGVFVLRSVIQLIFIKTIMKKLSVKGILFLVPLYDILALFINFNVYLSSIFRRKKTRWK